MRGLEQYLIIDAGATILRITACWVREGNDDVSYGGSKGSGELRFSEVCII